MSDGATTLKGKLSVGLAKWLGAAALLVLGGINSYGAWNTVTRGSNGALLGTNTGSLTQLNNVTVGFRDVIPLTMTGGKANYNLAIARMKDYGISGSGLTFTAMLAWIKAPAGGTSDIAVSKCRSGSSPNALTGTQLTTSTLFPNGNNLSNATGSLAGLSNTGSIRVNSDDCIKVASLTNPTSSGSGYLIIEGRDDPSE